MGDRVKRQWLWAVGASCGILGCCLLGLSLLAPVDDSVPAMTVAAPVIRKTQGESTKIKLSEQDFQFVWRKFLQGPLEEPKTVVAQPEAPPAVKESTPAIELDVKLIGTLVDGQDSRAWLEVRGKQQVLSIGEQVEGHNGSPVLKNVSHQRAVFQIGETMHEVRIATMIPAAGAIDD